MYVYAAFGQNFLHLTNSERSSDIRGLIGNWRWFIDSSISILNTVFVDVTNSKNFVPVALSINTRNYTITISTVLVAAFLRASFSLLIVRHTHMYLLDELHIDQTKMFLYKA